jgi:DNA-binding CsgD family transcriptional regulator
VTSVARTTIDSLRGSLDYDRMRVLSKRSSPKFFISDKQCNVVLSSPDLVDSDLLERGKIVLETIVFLADGEIVETVCHGLDAETMLRVVPLNEKTGGYFAVFFEAVSRNSVETATKRYDFTKRERDVLKLILSGSSTAQIAQSLFISEGTVGDHVKNMFRKTRTKRRSELIALIHDNTLTSR